LRSRAAGCFDPIALMRTTATWLDGRDLAYCQGFHGAIWAYLQITLEGCDVNLQTWQVLDFLRECRPH